MKETEILKKKYQTILDFLHQWQDDFHLYDLMDFHSMEFFYPLEEFSFLESHWDVNLSSYFADKLISFAVDGGGGHYCFWLYPELKGEAPIVYLDGHGGQEFLASNLNDFVNRMINELDFCGGWICEGDDVVEEFNNNLWQLIDRYQEEYNAPMSEGKVAEIFEMERTYFKEKVSEFIALKSTEEIKKDFNKHPSFDDWIKRVEEKNKEFTKVEAAKQLEETDIEELIQGFDALVKTNIISKSEIAAAIKNQKEALFNSKEFQDWMKE